MYNNQYCTKSVHFTYNIIINMNILITYLMLLEVIPLFLDEFPLPDSSSVSDIFVFLDLQYAMMRIMLAVKNNIPVTSRDTAIIM